MSADVGYRTRLKVRIGKGLTTSETSLEAEFNGRDVTVKSAKRDQPLEEASWLVMNSRGFANEKEAFEYGEQLRSAVHLAGLCTRVGVDGRAIGDNRTTSGFFAGGEEWLRSLGALQADEQVVNDVHGLMVLPDDENIRIFGGEARGRVTHDSRKFILAIEEAATKGVSHEVEHAIHVLNQAHINESPLAKVVLTISSIEALSDQNKSWTSFQTEIIDRATALVHTEFTDSVAVREVTDAIRRMRPVSLRQQAKRLLEQYDLLTWWEDWENVYGRRSSLFHGGVTREHGEVAELAADAMKVCARIVLSIAKRQGALLPTAAQVHFGVT